MSDQAKEPTCGHCKIVMTRENSRKRPELFLCDACAVKAGFATPDQVKEPSQWAMNAARELESPSGVGVHHGPTIQRFAKVIQSAIDAATADKDMQIERLKADLEIGVKKAAVNNPVNIS